MKLLLNSKILNVCKTLTRTAHLDWSPNQKISKKIWDRYRNLPLAKCKTQATYIWVDGTGENIRAKTRTLDFTPTSLKDIPNWEFDGSETYLAEICSSDVLLCPVAMYKDPITQGNNKLILCDTYEGGKPTKTNRRYCCVATLARVCKQDPAFGFEQQFYFMDVSNRPLGWPVMLGEPAPCISHYCSVGADKVYARTILECVHRCCLYCGVDMYGCNPEIAPSQWEMQIGPCKGIKAGDDLWIARYILQRVAEDFGVAVSFHPKLFPNWNGSACHTNFCTKETREDGGYKFIQEAIKKLERKHKEHLEIYDSCGTGRHDHCGSFTSGVGDRTASVKISSSVALKKKGYLEDRRPPANVDPYQVITALVRTVCLN